MGWGGINNGIRKDFSSLFFMFRIMELNDCFSLNFKEIAQVIKEHILIEKKKIELQHV